MKFGIDIHGTINKYPEFFAKFSHRVRLNGHQVIIITGSMKTPQIEKELKEIGIEYDNFFSISDYLIAKGCEHHFSSSNNPWFKAEDWDKSKADYCKENHVDLHFDDSPDYLKHFTTTYIKVA